MIAGHYAGRIFPVPVFYDGAAGIPGGAESCLFYPCGEFSVLICFIGCECVDHVHADEVFAYGPFAFGVVDGDFGISVELVGACKYEECC